MPIPTIYRPNPVFVPEHLCIRRDVLRYVDGEIKSIPFAEAGDIDLSWHDSRTLFYDTFIADEKNHLFCIAPLFQNFGTPKDILLMEHSLKFKFFTYARSIIIRVCIKHIKNQLQDGGKITFRFDKFSVSTIYQHISPATKRVHNVLVTHKKYHSIQWIKNWCLYYHHMCKINDIVIYDTGSQDCMRLKTELADVQDEINIILMAWDFPYGVNPNTTDLGEKHLNNYAQTTALSHHYALFGTKSDYVVNPNAVESFFTSRWDFDDSLFK